MDFIRKIVENKDPSFEELINCFEKVKAYGDVAVIKLDGGRDKDGYTVFVSFPNNKREMIRADESNLKKALIKVLLKYLEES